MSFQLGHKEEHTQHVHIRGRGGRLGCTSQEDFHSHTQRGGGAGYLVPGVPSVWKVGWRAGRKHLMVPSTAYQTPLLWREQFVIFFWSSTSGPIEVEKPKPTENPNKFPPWELLQGVSQENLCPFWVLWSGNETERFAVKTLCQSPARVNIKPLKLWLVV